MVPYLIRAWSTYIRTHSFHHTHTHARTHAHTTQPHTHTHALTHTHTHTHTTNTCITGDGLVQCEERKWQISMQKRRGEFSVLTEKKRLKTTAWHWQGEEESSRSQVRCIERTSPLDLLSSSNKIWMFLYCHTHPCMGGLWTSSFFCFSSAVASISSSSSFSSV